MSLTPIYDQLKGELLSTFPDKDAPPADSDSDPDQVDPLTRDDTPEGE